MNAPKYIYKQEGNINQLKNGIKIQGYLEINGFQTVNQI